MCLWIILALLRIRQIIFSITLVNIDDGLLIIIRSKGSLLISLRLSNNHYLVYYKALISNRNI